MNADQIRKLWLANPPEGLSKREVERMPDSHIVDLWNVLDESLEEIFENAEEIRIYGAPTCKCCGKIMKKVRR